MSVSAGTPLPADEDIEEEIDLNSFLVKHPNSTFFARVIGDAENFDGIRNWDLLVIDTYQKPEDGKLILVQLDQNLTIRRYRIFEGEEYIQTPTGQYLPINSSFFETLDYYGKNYIYHTHIVNDKQNIIKIYILKFRILILKNEREK
jgi:DNA polymerase V